MQKHYPCPAGLSTLADAKTRLNVHTLWQRFNLPGKTKADGVLKLLADKPEGITAREVCRKRIVGSADEARPLLARMEAEGILNGRDSKPEGGGNVTRIYTKARP